MSNNERLNKNNITKIIVFSIISIFLVVAFLGLVPIISRELDDRTITIVYDKEELSLTSVKENQITTFRFLGDENEFDKGEEFYLCIEQKESYKVVSIKIDGKDKTGDLLSYSNVDDAENLPSDIKKMILSNRDTFFIKIVVKKDVKIEIVSE